MWTRRELLCRAAGTALTLAGGGLAYRAFCNEDLPQDASPARGMITPDAQEAINRGLEYLAQNQSADGSWGTGRHRGNVAITALGGLAFMAGGHQPGRGEYGRLVTRALEYVLSQERDNYQGRPTPGFLYSPTMAPHGPMYGHGFGTLFLAEAHGMVYDRNLRQRLDATLRRAVQLILSAQNHEGGWRYRPMPADADLSVTICQIMALRAARNAGLTVPRSVADNCTQYVKDCQDLHRDGGFRYQRAGGPTGFARTAAGVVALYSAGVYEGPAVEKGLQYLITNCRPGANAGPFGFDNGLELHYYYGHYYAAQAMWIAGGRYWQVWFPAIRDELLRRRLPNGSWNDRICPHYGTAMACIILQVPNNYLPIFQR